MITRTRPAVGHAASVLASLANALGLPCVLASALVRPVRFSIVNPANAAWGQSDWFMPVLTDMLWQGIYRRKSDGMLYARNELTPSKPLWRSPDRLARVRPYDQDTWEPASAHVGCVLDMHGTFARGIARLEAAHLEALQP